MEIKDILYNLRTSNNLTQDEMAKKLFVTRQAVSHWENSKTIPNIETLKLISNIFDISINSIITDNKLNDVQDDKINSNRFVGFAQLYENSRPSIPYYACNILPNYLEHKPEQIADLGCGTDLSTMAWIGKYNGIIGVDPNEEMLSIAKQKSDKISFIKACSDNIPLPDNSTDIVICSQSFHWMNPTDTLTEVNRILKPNGIFATVDCDWPPVCNLEAELAYSQLLNKVRFVELENKDIYKTFQRWNKDKHL
ncbi:MAG: methyltransferase domain-containing protein [Clostridiales bacterium]|nr:methyltransferase domain-containing protein [Clostridiales bacterium]